MMKKNRGNEKEKNGMRPGPNPEPHHGPAPGLLLQLLEARAFWEHYAAWAMRPVWSMAARGDGHPVLMLPGLAAGDASTALLRRFLTSRGYGFGLGTASLGAVPLGGIYEIYEIGALIALGVAE